MNKFFFSILIVILTASCSEGDIINNDITNFDAPLENCANLNQNTFVFFKVDTDVNQSLSLSFTSTTFKLNLVPKELSHTIALNTTTNLLIHRKFASKINNTEYFCASVPPNGTVIAQELKSSDGNAIIKYTEKSQTSTSITYTRNITLSNITLKGNDISIRLELLNFGEDEITINK